jgi:dTDP-4-amino-4,6-dideoxygalactose transaminase
MPTGLHPMSNFTQAQMVGVIDFDNDRLQRISNFNFLFSELERVSLIKDMKGSAPLGFPIVLERRDEVRSALFKHNIYPPIHWAIQGVVPVQYKESHELSRRVMTIPCDGRYDSFDMRRIVSILENECGV